MIVMVKDDPCMPGGGDDTGFLLASGGRRKENIARINDNLKYNTLNKSFSLKS